MNKILERLKKEIAALRHELNIRTKTATLQNQIIQKLNAVIEEKEEILTELEKEIDKANGIQVQQ